MRLNLFAERNFEGNISAARIFWSKYEAKYCLYIARFNGINDFDVFITSHNYKELENFLFENYYQLVFLEWS